VALDEEVRIVRQLNLGSAHNVERSALQQLAAKIDDLYDLGRIDEGQQALTTALQESHGNPAYERYFQAEAAWYQQRSGKEQGRLLHEAAELAPTDVFLLRGVGIWQLMSNKTWSAVRTFDKVLALDPNDADTLRCMGIAHSRLDRDRKAIAFFRAALAINPHDGDALRQVGVSYSKLGEDQESLGWYKRALLVNDQDYDAMRQLGISLAMLNDLDGSMEWLRLAHAVNPHDYETRLNMALVLKKQRGEETWLERISIRLGRWFNRIWGKLLDLAGLR
jgi:Flp pilus assembly protein TadD